jgi:hypothetical protein
MILVLHYLIIVLLHYYINYENYNLKYFIFNYKENFKNPENTLWDEKNTHYITNVSYDRHAK